MGFYIKTNKNSKKNIIKKFQKNDFWNIFPKVSKN